jgi:hypothetical protein
MIALFVSALVVPPLRPLHALQALIYVAVFALAWRGSEWGYGAGATIGAAWNALQMFITRLAWAGAREWWTFLRTGHSNRVDTMMVSVGTLGHFAVIVGCLAPMIGSATTKRQWLRFAGGGALVLVYFGAIVALALPR